MMRGGDRGLRIDDCRARAQVYARRARVRARVLTPCAARGARYSMLPRRAHMLLTSGGRMMRGLFSGFRDTRTMAQISKARVFLFHTA